MTALPLLVIDLGLSAITAAAWVAAVVLTAGTASRKAARLAIGLVAIAVLGTVGQGIAIAFLSQHGWGFVQEKLVFALPALAIAAAIVAPIAVTALLAAARGRMENVRPFVPTAMIGAAAAAAAGVVARIVISYPISVLAWAALVLLVLLATWLGYAILARQGRRLIVGISVLSVLTLVSALGYAWLENLAGVPALAETHTHTLTTTAAETPAISVEELRTPADTAGPVRRFELTAQHDQVTATSGASLGAWTYGSLPGPELRVDQGDVVEVTLRNADIEAGVTIHWHGYDLPNGEDGVAGVTQNAVGPGDSFVYRFLAEDPGTYWYHTHQSSADGVRRGLYGVLVVLPRGGVAEETDLSVAVHTLAGTVFLGDSDTAEFHEVSAGASVRLRLVNTDQLPRRFRLTGTEFVVAAVDGRDLTAPGTVDNAALRIPAGGRYDVIFTMPRTGVLLTTDASSRATLSLAPEGADAAGLIPDHAAADHDLLDYGQPVDVFLAGHRQIEATMVLDRAPRFLHGSPAYGYTVNGEVYPHIPSIDVREGDVVEVTVVNRGWETHPMHIHGHHVLVLSRNGAPSSGSPLWLDTFDVQPGEVWVVALLADNPGIWMDHCHNLDHAREGMMMALRYDGITSPFEDGGEHGNRSE